MSEENARIEMDLLSSGSDKPYGSSRSIVRRIATSLPLKPCPRVQFQLNPYTKDTGYLRPPSRQSFLVASLADIGWIDREDDEDYFDRPRPGPPTGLVFRSSQSRPPRPLARRMSLPSLHQVDPDPQGPAAANNEAIQKIGALETELAKLRVQIAQIVLAQEKSSQLALATAAPSMLDVLKDLGKVKLRSVKREVEVPAKASSQPMDAASLIAEALKRKFAHRYRRDSEQEDDGEFTLPVPEEKTKPQAVAPLFGQHMLKSSGKRKFV
ncbi:hypothetical protein NHX12_021760 [Muraenolepis orangiensis]|uniref:Mitochondrial fission regulator n=1 Tax=Muraenolepis orangiensis TaxID=630683 RepID=A0A9Q0EU35_9TELE|nr:hypothetical protein NHX12_021760 [Muraenolepis orangiensis]